MEDLTNKASLDGGFEDVATESAGMFRAVLDAMSHPGTMQSQLTNLTPPAPLLPTCAAVILTLIDNDTPLWLAPELMGDDVVRYLKFHTGAALVNQASDAAFAVFLASEIPDLNQFQAGTPEYPDRSATMIIQIDGHGDTAPVNLSGPGIERKQEFSVPGLDEGFWRKVRSNNNRFPLGLDFVFCLSDAIAACPRSSAIMLEETV